ncbi:hypothetical protein HS088_TW03G01082 [Tripterygium wilfordii]|uniref:Uncharacterized protein n=1 Tax=Tripterygium wilfordii TaxID=458696 RepID=A0A7J7DWR8_TRIWF|nr:hypothetical protein HS088_TW03G01082 [Tripterygium wilfordii]
MGKIQRLLCLKPNHEIETNKSIQQKPVAVVPVEEDGFLRVYVGEEEHKLYVVPVACLRSRMFQALLGQFEMETSPAIDKPIELPCSPQMFEWILKLASQC